MISYTEEQLDTVITARDAFSTGLCMGGIRRTYLAEIYPITGVTYREFLSNGIAARDLLRTRNLFAHRVVHNILAGSKEWEKDQATSA